MTGDGESAGGAARPLGHPSDLSRMLANPTALVLFDGVGTVCVSAATRLVS